MIHVCFGLSDKDGRYSKFTGTAMLSIFENHSYPPPSVTVHILHDNTLSNNNRDKLSYIAGRYGQLIKFHNVEELCAEEINHLKKVFKDERDRPLFSIGKFYRLLTPYVLPKEIDKIIYLDSDIIVHLDISELWQMNIAEKPLAAVSEIEIGTTDFNRFILVNDNLIPKEDYFNSGIMLMNLKNIRENEVKNFWKAIEFRAYNPKCYFYDQDCLNLALSKNYLKLPNKFNRHPSVARNADKKINPCIYHYAWKSLSLDILDKFNYLWFSYFEKTPWFTKDVIWRMDEGYRQIVNQRDAGLKNLAIQLSALMSGKTRSFFIPAQNVDFMKKVFLVRDDEEIILHAEQESFNTLVKSMNESRGKKIFFILSEDYSQLRDELIQEGFVEGEDFINAVMFATYANGVPLNTYELIRNM